MAKTPTDHSDANFDALFGAKSGEKIVSGGFKMIPHANIAVKSQVRQTFAPLEIEELRASIRELRAQGQGIEGTGVLQALLVCPEGAGYRLLAGEKRFRATRDEQLENVPCIVVAAPKGEGTVRLLQLTENALRTNPPVLEEARAIKATMDEQGLSMRDMARLLGKTLGYISNRTALLKMRDDVREMVAQRGDTLRVAAHIEKVENTALRAQLIAAVIEEGIGEREVLRRIEVENGVFSRENTPAEENPRTGAEKEETSLFSRENSDAPSQSALKIGESDPRNPTPTENETRPEAIEKALVPARQHAAQAVKLLRGLPLEDSYRDQVRGAVLELEKQIQKLKKIVG